MPVTINGSTGISGNDGSAATPAIQGTDTNTGMYFPGNDRIGFAEDGVQVAEFDASANFLFNSGYGSVARAFGCRAWVNFNGIGTVAIRGSGNVSSITDNNPGDYTVNFTVAMPDANYSTHVALGYSGSNAPSRITNIDSATYTTSAVRVRAGFAASTFEDQSIMNVSIFR